MTYAISYESNPSPKDIQILGDGIVAYAKQKKGHKPMEFFAFFIRDEKGSIVGGCNGAMYYGCLYIDLLWISEALRNKDYGTQLMQNAEKLGREHECTFAAVNTMDWEALGFYKKLGFEVEFERRGFVKDSVFYFLRKELESS